MVIHLKKAPRKSFLIKPPLSLLVVLFCIISMLQKSVAIRAAFVMQINLTAQQSDMLAPVSFPFIHLPSPSFLRSFPWHLEPFLHLHFFLYEVSVCITQGKGAWLLVTYDKC